MGCSIYNGSILPDLPDSTLPYALILKGTDTAGAAQTILWLCSQPFEADGDVTNAFDYPEYATIAAYAADMINYTWRQGQVVTTTVKGAEYCRITGSLVWSSHDVYLHNVDPPVMPTWNKSEYPYLLIKRSNLSNAMGELLADAPEYEAFYSAMPFAWRDIAGDILGWFGWQIEPLGAQFMNLTETDTGYTTDGWYIDEAYGQFGYSGVYSSVQGPSYDPTSAVALATNFWANHDITGVVNGSEIKANSWFKLLCYEQGTVEEIAVLAPTDVTVTGGGTYDQGTTADALTCTAVSPDGGTLSYKWYKDGVVCGYTASHTPSTKTAGTFEYYCVVTNSKYGDKVTAQSETLTVVVNAVEVEEEATVRKPVEVIGYVLKLCGVPCAELVAQMIGKLKKTATMYLYGTPSDSGTIGLRSGDTVTLYDGAVLSETIPELPEWDVATYPYAVMWMGVSFSGELNTVHLWACDKPFKYNPETYALTTTAGAEYSAFRQFVTVTNPAWSNYGSGDSGNGNIATLGKNYGQNNHLVWANHDVERADTSGVYLSASSEPSPIPVTGIVAYSYNGTVLLEIPEKVMSYPYVILIKNADNWYNAYGLSAEPYTEFYDSIFSDYDRLRLDSGNHCPAEYQVDEWGYVGEETSVTEWTQGYAAWKLSNIVWANFDLYASDETVYLAASDPIPVYE